MSEFQLPELSYEYDALEPHIDAQTMEIHHSKHHQAYTNGLNDVWDEMSEDNQNKGLLILLSDLDQIKPEIRDRFNFHGGGYNNHELFWSSMKPNGGGEPVGVLKDEINKVFGSFDDFKKKFSADTAVIQGSGWGWLVYEPKSKKIQFRTTANQDSPIVDGVVPLLGLDVWEHAYYLKYENKRPDYISAWWNVVNWEEVENRFSRAATTAKALFSRHFE
ncbi:MAG: superoxide dismutase [Nitrosopumilus sp.]|uniref:superoxide dismutase n=1 Tax=Nitrosopumilus sp. TaxID=2024843 RepID=UPI00247C20F0|nr:superoxide dismutase [Nitrosopumilus sp.]MCV0393152.1 superoxide dismutase [Nitrosopumilus sp.]